MTVLWWKLKVGTELTEKSSKISVDRNFIPNKKLTDDVGQNERYTAKKTNLSFQSHDIVLFHFFCHFSGT